MTEATGGPPRRRWLRRAAAAGWLAAGLGGFALSAAMTLSGAVFEAVATTVRAATGLATVAASPAIRYRGAVRPLREAVADTTRRVAARTARGAARSVASAAGQAVPVAGAAVVASVTVWELYDACETMKDLRALEAALGGPDDPDVGSVCGLEAPSLDPLRAWSPAAAQAVPGAAP